MYVSQKHPLTPLNKDNMQRQEFLTQVFKNNKADKEEIFIIMVIQKTCIR